MFRYEYYRPATIQEALGLMERFNGDAVYIAGGTDVMVLMRQKKLRPKALISLRNIKELIAQRRACHRRGGDPQGDPAGRRDKKALFARSTTRSVAWARPRSGTWRPSEATSAMQPLRQIRHAPSSSSTRRRCSWGPRAKGTSLWTTSLSGPARRSFRGARYSKSSRCRVLRGNTGSAYIKHTRRNAMDLPIIGIAVTGDRQQERPAVQGYDLCDGALIRAAHPFRRRGAQVRGYTDSHGSGGSPPYQGEGSRRPSSGAG